MIGPTLDELITDIRNELSEGDADFFTDSSVTSILNNGQDTIAANAPWACVDTFQTTTVKGQASYMLPASAIQGAGASLRLPGGSPYRLEYIEPNAVDANRSFVSNATGTPRRVTYRQGPQGVTAEIWPVPATTGLELSVYCRVRPTPLETETDRTTLLPLCRPTLVLYALSRLKRKDEETQQGRDYAVEFKEAMADLRAHRMRSQADKANINLARRSLWSRWGVYR